MEQLKQLMEQIRGDWNSLKDKLEIDIVEKCASNVRIFTISVMGNTIYSYICVKLFFINNFLLMHQVVLCIFNAYLR